MGRGFYLRYFDYIFDTHNISTNQSLFSEIDKKEIISVINIITNNPIKSVEILSSLEQIYQTKLDNKVLLAQEIIADNVEYQGRLFELRGIYIENNGNTECHQNRLTTFSVT